MATQKQRKAVEKVLENSGNVSKAMREAGYSPATAKNPKHLTESKGFIEELKKVVPEDRLNQVLEEGLGATRASNAAILVTKEEGGEVIKAEEQGLIEVPDFATRHKYMETGYKLYKRVGQKDEQDTSDITYNILVYNEKDDNNSSQLHSQTVSVENSTGHGEVQVTSYTQEGGEDSPSAEPADTAGNAKQE